MQKPSKIILLVFYFLINDLNAQSNFYLREDLTKYLEGKEDLDAIEGIWSLNVIRSLFIGEEMVGQEIENDRTTWAILKAQDSLYRVTQFFDISLRIPIELEHVDAWFHATENPDSFYYLCHFYDPEWVAETSAFLQKDTVIMYAYFTSDSYVKEVYKEDYVPGTQLHWLFYWKKEYPLGSALIKL